MNRQKKDDPLWIITFDNQKKDATWIQRAKVAVPPPEPIYQLLITRENQKIAIDFLEKVNASFREITENYLADLDRNGIHTEEVKEIREKFDSLDHWIAWIRIWLNGGAPSEKPPEDPK